MIHINPDYEKIVKAKDIHYKTLRYIILKKLKGTDFTEKQPDEAIGRITKINIVNQEIFDFFVNEDNLKSVLIGLPIEINKIKENFKDLKCTNSKGNEISELKKLINYDSWTDKDKEKKGTHRAYNAYNLAENLDFQTCVYCNRIYTKNVIKPNKITRPEFDHWFKKSDFPILALSFYNLIPSCHICNSSIKGTGTMELDTHFHPYVDNEEVIKSAIKFSYYNKKIKKYGFNVKTASDKAKNTVAFFKLKEIYETHEDEIADLRKIKDAYSDRYLQILATQYKGLNTSEEELYRLAFGTEIEESKFSNRPLSKMKKDILIELGIIKETESKSKSIPNP